MDRLPLLAPMLAETAAPFDSPDHLYEVKWDGYRGLAYLDGTTTVRSRSLADLTGRFPELAAMHRQVTHQPAILDGEIVILEGGKPSFARLQSRARQKRPVPAFPAVFIAFDVLYAGGSPVLDLPLMERKRILHAMVTPDDRIMLSEYLLADGIAFYDACVRAGLEGTMAKKLSGAYLPGRRSANWQKFRHTREADLVVCGFQPGRGGRALGSLVLCGARDGRYVYQGKVGSGWDDREAQTLLAALRRIETDRPAPAVPRDAAGKIVWVRPLLVCAVEYLAVTGEGLLRHPVYRGLRFDKRPEECPPPVRA